MRQLRLKKAAEEHFDELKRRKEEEAEARAK